MLRNHESRRLLLWTGLAVFGALALASGTGPRAGAAAGAAATRPRPGGHLLLWNKLGSRADVQHSQVGPNGTFQGGQFVPGVFGYAYSADSPQDSLVTFPKEVIHTDAGTIEFWAQLSQVPVSIPSGGGESPALVKITDGYSEYGIHLNSNDGAANGGLCAWAGHGITSGTGLYGSWTYAQVLRAGKEATWHHYAVVWDKDGIPGVGLKVAAYLDGRLNSANHNYRDDAQFVPLMGGTLGLISSQTGTPGRVALDNIEIWNYAKTDFSGRFYETPSP